MSPSLLAVQGLSRFCWGSKQTSPMESARAAAQAGVSSAVLHRIGKWTSGPLAALINGPPTRQRRSPRPPCGWGEPVISDVDLGHLRRCVELAARSLAAGDEPFGSVLVAGDGTVLGEDHNHVASGDRTQHPEFALARWAARHLTPAERKAATVYTSGEHCPTCAAAHGWGGPRPYRVRGLRRATGELAHRVGCARRSGRRSAGHRHRAGCGGGGAGARARRRRPRTAPPPAPCGRPSEVAAATAIRLHPPLTPAPIPSAVAPRAARTAERTWSTVSRWSASPYGRPGRPVPCPLGSAWGDGRAGREFSRARRPRPGTASEVRPRSRKESGTDDARSGSAQQLPHRARTTALSPSARTVRSA